jgi:FlaA1/EpsC-like NDP-sugar epimerase
VSGANNEQIVSRGQALASAASRVRTDIVFAFLDVFVVVSSYNIGMALRMIDRQVVDVVELWIDLAIAMPVILVVHIVANMIAGAYGHVWEHASTSEAVRVALANGAATALLFILSLMVRPAVVVPLSVIVIGGLVSLLSMGMIRFRSRLFSFHRASGAVRILVVGISREAVSFARTAPTLLGGRVVIGFVSHDDDGPVSERRLAGLEILGSLKDLRSIIRDHTVEEVVVVGSDAARTRRVVDLCLDIDVRLRILPSAEDVIKDGVAAVDVRDVSVEDILVRSPVETDLSAVRDLLKDKRVLVTGAGGSIGSEIVHQVQSFGPSAVWALDRDETLLHDAILKWQNGTQVVLADIREAGRLVSVFEEIKPHVVFHAAALKHVPMLEDFPIEAVLTNVVGTRNVIEAGSRAGMERFVLISTDKAVAPTNVMGATKRVAEIMVQAGADRNDGCIYTAVRFGNVLGSRGSVIPTFVEQIKHGGPVTVTHPEMTRYFMTVDEAVQLVLQASAMSQGSEVFVLDMGEPVRIVDLARRLIRLAGLSPGRDIEIRLMGARPGEKLTEVLSTTPLNPTSHDKIGEVRLSSPRAAALSEAVMELEDAARTGEEHLVTKRLMELAHDETPGESGAVIDLADLIEADSWS